MKNEMKWKIKTMLSFMWHPIVSSRFLVDGCSNFYLCKHLKINSVKLLTVGDEFYLGNNSRIHFIQNYHGKSYNPFLKIGKQVDIGQRFTALCAAPIVIEDNALLASDILITSENHGMDPESEQSYAKQPLIAKPIKIGKGCWIGEKVSIMPGVTLGEKVIVAANSVVTKSFPSYTLIGGVPAKVIKKYDFNQHKWVKNN